MLWNSAFSLVSLSLSPLPFALLLSYLKSLLKTTTLPSWISFSCFSKNIFYCFIDYAKAFDNVHHNKLWNILQEMGIPDHITSLLRNLYAGQLATVRTGHGTMHWFKIGKGVRQGCILSPCLFNLYPDYTIWNAGLDDSQAGSKIVGRNINNIVYADDTTLMAKWEGAILASNPITSLPWSGWVNNICFSPNREKVETVKDCSHEIKRCLLLGKIAMTNLDSILKSRDITLLTKVLLVKAMVFPVVMYKYESWTIKNAEHRLIDALELWCWRRLLRVPWTARRSK